MLSWLKQLDDLLRGRKTAPEQIPSSDFPLPLGVFVPLAILLSGTYGFFMGWYALFAHDSPGYLQLLACMLKLPALFLLTLVVTLPSLYVFNAIIGCRLTFVAMLRLLVGAIVVNVAVAASLGPILAFFTVSTTSYPFMILLNVVLLTVAGFFGLAFLLQTLRRLAVSRPPPNRWTLPKRKKTRTTPFNTNPVRLTASFLIMPQGSPAMPNSSSIYGSSSMDLSEPRWVGCCAPL